MSTENPSVPPSHHQPGHPTPTNGNGAQQRRRILAGVASLVILALGLLAYWFIFMRGIVYTDDARIGGHLVDVAPEVNGRLLSVDVREGDRVAAGTLFFRLDPAVPAAALRQAEAALGSARATLASNEALLEKSLNGNRPEEIEAAAATLRRLQSEEGLARIDFERTQTMFRQNTVSQDDLDRARTAYESAHQSRENAVQNLQLLREGSRPEDIAVARAAVALARSRIAEAEAAVANARGELARYTVVAPFAGWVVRRWLDPGAMPLAAQPVVSLFDPATIRVDANVEEQDLAGVQVGDLADISVDAFSDLRLRGRVTRIMRAANSEFSLIPAEGVAGTFIKVTQRVPIQVSLEVPPNLPLGPGLSVVLHIHSNSAPAGASPHGDPR